MSESKKPFDWDGFFKALATFIMIAIIFAMCMGLGPKAFVQKMMFSF